MRCTLHYFRHLRGQGENGSGTLLGVGILILVTTTTILLLAVGQAVDLGQRVGSTADLAALAGAAAQAGTLPGDPCTRAQQTAQRAGLELGSCIVDEDDVSVLVLGNLWGLGVSARARAGPAR